MGKRIAFNENGNVNNKWKTNVWHMLFIFGSHFNSNNDMNNNQLSDQIES